MKKIIEKFQGLKLNIKFTLIIVVIVLIPIIALSTWLFKSMENNVIFERENAVKYKQGKDYDQIIKNVDSINMSTQFFLSDQGLKEFLLREKKGDYFSAAELIVFYNEDIASLERMVNNNPYLYQIRVYVDSKRLQEMMPILYRQERMEKLSWSTEPLTNGWKYDYTDTIFDSFMMNQSKKILSLVTFIEDYSYGCLGILEVAMRMEDMFPALYEGAENQWSCFIDSQGEQYFSEISVDNAQQIVKLVMEDNSVAMEQASVVYGEMEGKKLVAGYQPVKELGGYLITVEDITQDVQKIINQRNLFILFTLVILIGLVWGINEVVKGLLKQFYSILKSIRRVQRGDLNVIVENCGTDEMGELGSQINKMLDSIKQLMEDNIKHELLVKNTEIRALQNQINAHFIYNVLESIKMMAEIDEKYEISDAITTLGHLLRYSMKWTSGNVSVEEELEYIRNYLVLINLRFDYEIYLSENIPEAIRHQQIPKMSLQPIVENAIYHGIEQMAEDTNIYIKGIVEGEDCIIEITDAGRGMSEEDVEKLYKKLAGEIETTGGSGNGIGLKNVQDRIRMNFGEEYGIEISSKLGCYTKILVRIPMT